MNKLIFGSRDFENWCKQNNREDLLVEWNNDKNSPLTPDQITAGSNKKVWWKCSDGHDWLTSVYNRTNGSGCPYCSGRYPIKGKTDLATLRPDLAKEWDYEKNINLKPEDFTVASGKRVWWICSKGHSFATSIGNRTKQNTGCAVCSSKKILKGFNDFKTLYPSLMNEWDFSKNTDVSPDEEPPFSKKRVWWKCSNCNENWCAPIASRSNGHGCPKCSRKKAEINRYGTLLSRTDSFASKHPELLEEWDYEKNNELGILPENILPNSNKSVWWICKKCNHNWKSIINNRSKGVGCPICSTIIGREKLVSALIDKRGSLASSNSPLLNEWDYEKNVDVTPYDVMAGTHKKVWWKCNCCGNSWKSSIVDRKTRGCPQCAKERHSSFQEQAIYYYLSKIYPDTINGYTGFGYELDVYIPQKQIAIEYDGQLWHQNIEKDLLKNSKCEIDGIFLYRIREEKCPKLTNTPNLFCYVCKPNGNTKQLNDIIHDLCYRISGERISVDIDRDNQNILSLFVKRKKENSLESLYPDLAKEWDLTKNMGIKPSMVMSKTNKKFWWICSKGHSFASTVNNRAKGNKCPYCSNKLVLKGFNDLETVNPDLAKEWNYGKNNATPQEILSGSNKKYWWICKKGHEWEAQVKSRMEGCGCPFCAGKKAIQGENDLTITHPELTQEWNYEKNSSLPQNYKAGSNVKVWWKCSKGHEWQAFINNRALQDNGCPYCSNHKVLPGFNDLATKYPELAAEWLYEKNDNLKPTDVSCGSGKKVWWKCAEGHEWQSTIANRTNKNRGCPICSRNSSGQRYINACIMKKGSLFDNNPKLASEWHPSKNLPLTPKDVTAGTNTKAWWKCSKCGHEWQASIASRNKGIGCPRCAIQNRKKKQK